MLSFGRHSTSIAIHETSLLFGVTRKCYSSSVFYIVVYTVCRNISGSKGITLPIVKLSFLHLCNRLAGKSSINLLYAGSNSMCKPVIEGKLASLSLSIFRIGHVSLSLSKCSVFVLFSRLTSVRKFCLSSKQQMYGIGSSRPTIAFRSALLKSLKLRSPNVRLSICPVFLAKSSIVYRSA